MRAADYHQDIPSLQRASLVSKKTSYKLGRYKMKRLNEIMQELGFDKEGNQDVQKAFIKNLIKQAGQADKVKAIYPEQKTDNKPPSTHKKGVSSATYMSNFRKLCFLHVCRRLTVLP